MTDRDAQLDRLADLAIRYFDGLVEADEFVELSALIRDDQAAARLFNDLCLSARTLIETHASRRAADTAAHAGADDSRGVRKDAREAKSGDSHRFASRYSRRFPTIALAASLLLAACGVAIYLTVFNSPPHADDGHVTSRDPALDIPIATLTDATGVVWASDPLNGGDEVSPQTIRTEDGDLELVLNSGTMVNLAGATDLRLDSPMSVAMMLGQATFTCPRRAIGFTVLLPGGVSVIDLGTEFAVEVAPNGASRVRVLTGSVELRTATDRLVLSASQTVGVQNGVARLIEDSPDPRWSKYVQTLLADPTLVRFDSMNEVGNVVGRFPGDKALRRLPGRPQFRVNEDGPPHEAITLAAWVRLDRPVRALSALLVSERDDPGRIHWQLRPGGPMTLGTDVATDVAVHQSTRNLTAAYVGRWVMIAVVADPANRRVRFYIDGEPAGDHALADGELFKVADAVIGDSVRWPGRPLSGCMIDDLTILARAMSDDEIKSFCEAGTPPQINPKEAR